MRLIFFILFSFYSFVSIGSELPQNIQNIIKGKNSKEQIPLLDSISYGLRSENFPLAIKISRHGLSIAKQNDFKLATVKTYLSIVMAYRSKGLYDTALLYIDSTKTFAFNNNLSEKYASIFDVEGLIYTKMADYKNAASAFYKCIEYAEKINDSAKLHDAFSHIGTMHFYRTNYRDAIIAYKKSLSYLHSTKITKSHILTIDNIALCYSNSGNLDSALVFQRQVILQGEKILDSTFLAECYVNIGTTLANLTKFQESEQYLLKGKSIHVLVNNEYGILISNMSLGKMYIQSNQIQKSLSPLENAYQVAEHLKLPNQIKEISHDLALAFDKKGDYKKSAYYYSVEADLVKKIYAEENVKAINELSVKYESEKQQQQIQLLTKDKQLKDEQIGKERNLRVFIGIAASLFLIISLILFFRFKEKKKDNKLLHDKNEAIALQKNQIESQKELLQIKNQETTDSINYAKRIQASVLPSEQYFKKLLPDSFIYFKPKDIVSGDFYWVNENENFIYLVLADCTGHGVPGPMMSMLGTSLLNQIIQNSTITSPSAILKELHFHIVKTLNENIEKQDSVDGMDIAVVRIDSNNKELVYSGAGRPLYFKVGNEFKEIKSNKFAIGSIHNADNVCIDTSISFKNETIQIYLFSDGVIDQFGGEKGKKFMSKQLQAFVINAVKAQISEQEKQFAGLFEQWKGHYDQIDDITLISIKLS